MTEESKAKTLIEEARKLFAGEPPWTVEAHDARGDYVRIALVRRDPSFECGYYVIADDDMLIRRVQAIADFRRFIQCRALVSQLCDELDQQLVLNATQAESLSTCHARMKLQKEAIEAARTWIKSEIHELQSTCGGHDQPSHCVTCDLRHKAQAIAAQLVNSITPKGETK